MTEQSGRKTIGRYVIEAKIGQGGMAEVYAAYDPQFQRKVAIKVLPAYLLQMDPTFAARFQREAMTIANLEHPAIVPVYDFGEDDGRPYLVMRLMNGGSLEDRLKEGPISLKETSEILARLAPAIDKAHAQGIIHRDLKPGNILFDHDGWPYLADFGIVRLQDSATSLTQSGIIGTPAYMSPEQARGRKDLDGRSDIYALGAILFQMLSGRLPYESDTPHGYLMAHLNDPVPEIREFLPGAKVLQGVIAKAMAKDKEDRYGSAGEIANVLETLSRRELAKGPVAPTRTLHWIQKGSRIRRYWPWLMALGVLALIPMIIGLSGGFSGFSAAPTETKYAQTLVPIGTVTTSGTLTSSPTDAPSITNTPTFTPRPTNTSEPTINPYVISAENAGQVREIGRIETGIIYSPVVISPDGTILASGSEENTIQIWRVSDGSLMDTFEGHTNSVISLAFSPDGAILASGSWDLTVRLWRVSDGRLLDTLSGHTGNVMSVAFSPDGKTLASGSDDSSIRLWRTSDGTRLHTLEGRSGTIYSVAFSPDGETLASGSYQNTVQLWRVSDGTLLHTLNGHNKLVWSVAFSPDGRTLASGSADSIIRLWRVSDGTLLRSLVGLTGYARCVTFSPDGQILASGSDDNSIRLWRVSDGALLHTLEGLTDYVRNLEFSRDGTILVSGLSEGTIRLWGVP